MIPLVYVIAVSIALIAIGFSGIALDRNLIVIILGVELVLIASMIALVGAFSYSTQQGGDAVAMLLAIFTVAAAEAVAVITFYIHMKSLNMEFDVTKLSKMKW